jgi:hypothetical protein
LPQQSASKKNLFCEDGHSVADIDAELDECLRLIDQHQYAHIEGRVRPLLLLAIRRFGRQFHMYSYEQRTQKMAKAETTRLTLEAKTFLARTLGMKADLDIEHGKMVTATMVLSLAVRLDKEAVVLSKKHLLELIDKGFPDISLTIVTNLLARNPGDPEVQQTYALLTGTTVPMERGPIPAAVVSVCNASVAEKIQDAETLINDGEIEKARIILNEILIAHPTHIDALNNLTVLEIMDLNWRVAAVTIQKVISLDPSNEIALQNLQYLERTFPRTD